MNAFFAEVEQRCNPALRGKPIFVCGEGRTVVTTASYEARAFGVKTGMTKYEALRRCPRAIPVIGNHQVYMDVSERLWDMLITYTDRAEMFSVDEAFLDLTGGIDPFETPEQLARHIKDRVRAELGLRCSIGIAPNKLLAKLGSDMEKPDGLVVIHPDDVPAILENLPVEDFCGIGEKTRQHLAQLGIRYSGQLGAAPLSMLQAHFGFLGHFLKRMGQGRDDAPAARYTDEEIEKSVGHSYTLPRDTRDEQRIHSYILWLTDRVGRRLRRKGLAGRVVSCVVRYSDFRTQGRQQALNKPIDSARAINAAACRILDTFRPFRLPVRLLGVSIAGLSRVGGQLCLFDEDRKRAACQQAADHIRDLFGESALIPAATLIRKKPGGRT